MLEVENLKKWFVWLGQNEKKNARILIEVYTVSKLSLPFPFSDRNNLDSRHVCIFFRIPTGYERKRSGAME